MFSANFFAGLHTVEEIKVRYRELAMQYHPDRGGDTATMQRVNEEYRSALKRCDGYTTTDKESGKRYTYKYNEQKETLVIEKIDEILKSGILNKGVEIYLIGAWIWIMGDTRPVKEELKELGCRWHAKRGVWYWHDWSERSYRSSGGLQDIAARYGAEKIVDNEKTAKPKNWTLALV